MAVYTTLEQTKEVAYGAAQGALDLVKAQNYVKAGDVDTELSEESDMPVQNKVIATALNEQSKKIENKVSVEVIGKQLIFK